MFSFKKFSKLQYHKTLNPKIWDNDTLKPEIRQHLLQIAAVWLEHAKIIPADAIVDYLLVGGNTNFNFTKMSDLDVHILVDPDKLNIAPDVAHDIIMDKKNTWAATHHILVAGYPVELYAQLTTEHIPDGQGVFSLGKNTWLVHPTFLNIKYDSESLHKRVEDYKNRIDAVIAAKDVDQAKQLKSEIAASRGEGLARGGEFDELPTAFKAIRNSGYLDKLSKFIITSQDTQLSL